MANSKTKHHGGASATVYGSTLIVFSTIFYGSYGVWTRLMGNSFGAYAQAWIRCVLVILFLLPFALFGRQKWQPMQWRKNRFWISLLLMASLLISGPLYYAINKVGIGLAILCMYSGTLISMFFCGWLFSGERYSADKFIATALALVGLLLTCSPSFGTASIVPLTAALVSGVAIGVNVVASQKIQYNSSQTAIVAWSTGVVVNVPAAFILHEHVPSLHADMHWMYLVFFAMASFASSWSVIHGVKLIEAGAAGIIGLLEIVWSLLFGTIFFHEHPGTLAYLGAVCIIAAAAIPYIKEFKHVDIAEERIA
jgi:drug/metabolite transporter (DMT)-like permease